MHELSIALSVIEGAEQQLAEQQLMDQAGVGHGAERVAAVHLRLGPLAGVVAEALTFSFDIAAEGTLLEGAHLVIEEVPIRIYCETCQAEQAPESAQCLRCPRCGGSECDVTEGDELELVALELETVEEENVAAPLA